jgi:hypothetical protein
MTKKTYDEAYSYITAHISEQGGKNNNWYVGISDDARRRLSEHQVPEDNYWHIFCTCIDNEIAREVEKALIESGCDGGEGGGDDASTQIYAYLKSSVTDP